jgi:hypothetical protein
MLLKSGRAFPSGLSVRSTVPFKTDVDQKLDPERNAKQRATESENMWLGLRIVPSIHFYPEVRVSQSVLPLASVLCKTRMDRCEMRMACNATQPYMHACTSRSPLARSSVGFRPYPGPGHKTNDGFQIRPVTPGWQQAGDRFSCKLDCGSGIVELELDDRRPTPSHGARSPPVTE